MQCMSDVTHTTADSVDDAVRDGSAAAARKKAAFNKKIAPSPTLLLLENVKRWSATKRRQQAGHTSAAQPVAVLPRQ